MDATEYKHVVLSLIFLEYISDAFEEQHANLEAGKKHDADSEDLDDNFARSKIGRASARPEGASARDGASQAARPLSNRALADFLQTED